MLFKNKCCWKKVSLQSYFAGYLNYSRPLINGVVYWISEQITQTSGGNTTAILVGIVAVIIIIIIIVMLFLYVSRYVIFLCWSSSVQIVKILLENCQFVAIVFYSQIFLETFFLKIKFTSWYSNFFNMWVNSKTMKLRSYLQLNWFAFIYLYSSGRLLRKVISEGGTVKRWRVVSKITKYQWCHDPLIHDIWLIC